MSWSTAGPTGAGINVGFGTGVSSTASTSLSFTFASAATTTYLLPAGNYMQIHIASDNVSTGDSETSLVTGITDTKGNTWSKIAEFTNGNTAPAAGATVSIWHAINADDLTVSDAMVCTITFSSSVTAKAASGIAFLQTTGKGRLPTVNYRTLAVDAAVPGTLTLSSQPTTAKLFMHTIAVEAANNFTADISSINGSLCWGPISTDAGITGTTGGGAAGNMGVKLKFSQNMNSTSTTVTSDWNDTGLAGTADIAQIFMAVMEAAAQPSLVFAPFQNIAHLLVR